MKKIAQCVVVLAVVFATSAAFACSATQIFERAEGMKRTPEFSMARDVVVQEYLSEHAWTKVEALDAAIGTLLRENWEQTRFNDQEYLTDTIARGVELLELPTLVGGAWGHTEAGIVTIRDHALVHGYEWEHDTDYCGVDDAVTQLLNNADAMKEQYEGTAARDAETWRMRGRLGYGLDQFDDWSAHDGQDYMNADGTLKDLTGGQTAEPVNNDPAPISEPTPEPTPEPAPVAPAVDPNTHAG
jgi:hypothetical protein